MELERTSMVKAADKEYEHQHFVIKINIHVSYDIGFYVMFYNTIQYIRD
jgi:general stress protein CsbA